MSTVVAVPIFRKFHHIAIVIYRVTYCELMNLVDQAAFVTIKRMSESGALRNSFAVRHFSYCAGKIVSGCRSGGSALPGELGDRH